MSDQILSIRPLAATGSYFLEFFASKLVRLNDSADGFALQLEFVVHASSSDKHRQGDHVAVMFPMQAKENATYFCEAMVKAVGRDGISEADQLDMEAGGESFKGVYLLLKVKTQTLDWEDIDGDIKSTATLSIAFEIEQVSYKPKPKLLNGTRPEDAIGDFDD